MKALPCRRAVSLLCVLLSLNLALSACGGAAPSSGDTSDGPDPDLPGSSEPAASACPTEDPESFPETPPGTQPETDPPHGDCVFNAFGLCPVCGASRAVTAGWTSPYTAWADDAVWRYLGAAYELSLRVSLSLSGNGRYELTKTLISADGTADYGGFAFRGAYSAAEDGTSLTLALPEEAVADLDLTAYAHVAVTGGPEDTGVLSAFPTGYLCDGMEPRSQVLTLDADGHIVFAGDDCTHPSHGMDRICTSCGRTVGHRMEGSVCTVCGYEAARQDKHVPAKYLKKCPRRGKVDQIIYKSRNYATGAAQTNTVFVYLPYGYDPDDGRTYNVLYLLHGSGENAAYWLAQLNYAGGYTEQTLRLLDNLNDCRACEPTIVVTPTENLNGTGNFYRELQDYLIPLIETRYRTKAGLYGLAPEEVTVGDMINSRDSRAFAGLSLGSIITWDIMGRHLDKFAYFGFYSGGTCGQDRKINLRRTLRDSGTAAYPIRFAYHSCGTADSMYADHVADYDYFLTHSDRFREGDNTVFVHKANFAHNYSSWIIDLYNSLAVDFFRH